jgi:ABC-type uncharacterized transport system substrate-binding protein
MKYSFPLLGLFGFFICILIFFQPALTLAGKKLDFSTKPVSKNEHKWRIGYLEGGPYSNYPINLIALAEGLSKLGWVDKLTFKKKLSGDTADIWKTLAMSSQSNFIEFVIDAYWSSNWEKTLREKNRNLCMQRLKNKELDCVIAMGTWAGQDLANNEHSVPIVGIDISDPLGSNIIKHPSDSGFDHVYVRCDPEREIRKLRIFHGLFNFKRLGVAYVDSPDGRAYAAIDDIYQVAKEKQFQVISCEAPVSDSNTSICVEGILKCHQDLAQKVDALFITTHRGMAVQYMHKTLFPLFQHNIPTFSQRGVEEVQYGVLMSISTPVIGLHNAKVITSIFNGIKPNDIDQILKDPLRIAINLESAKKINYKFPANILRLADKIYTHIKTIPPSDQ